MSTQLARAVVAVGYIALHYLQPPQVSSFVTFPVWKAATIGQSLSQTKKSCFIAVIHPLTGYFEVCERLRSGFGSSSSLFWEAVMGCVIAGRQCYYDAVLSNILQRCIAGIEASVQGQFCSGCLDN